MPTDLPETRSFASIRDFEAKLRQGCARCGLEEWKGPLLVGYSGGGDSTALLLSLASLTSGRGRWPSSLIAVHVNHGLRPETAERDARHAESLCKSRGISFRRIDATPGDVSGRGPEAAARETRRAAFLEAARATGARAVALAHTLDDQAETILMRLLEGAGIRGMTGMRPQAPLQEEPLSDDEQPVYVLRPLLEVSRAEARAYLEALGAEWVEDETNAEDRHLRNRLRLHVFPAIEKISGEGVAGRIAASADHLAAALDVLKNEVGKAREKFFSNEKERIRVAPLSEVSRLPQAVRASLWEAALNEAYRNACKDRKRIPLERLVRMIDRLATQGGPSSSLNLPGAVEARRDYDAISFGPETETRQPPEGEVPLALPGRTVHPHLNVAIEAIPADQFHGERDGKMTVFLEADELRGGAVLRARREGDRFHPAGAPGEKKLKDFFIDQKVPYPERAFVPLVAAGKEVIWTVGRAVSQKYAAGPNSREGFVLKATMWPETVDISLENK
ncbi:MAG: tRNA lysidine(34) synthetase TilS [bacterium]